MCCGLFAFRDRASKWVGGEEAVEPVVGGGFYCEALAVGPAAEGGAEVAPGAEVGGGLELVICVGACFDCDCEVSWGGLPKFGGVIEGGSGLVVCSEFEVGNPAGDFEAAGGGVYESFTEDAADEEAAAIIADEGVCVLGAAAADAGAEVGPFGAGPHGDFAGEGIGAPGGGIEIAADVEVSSGAEGDIEDSIGIKIGAVALLERGIETSVHGVPGGAVPACDAACVDCCGSASYSVEAAADVECAVWPELEGANCAGVFGDAAGVGGPGGAVPAGEAAHEVAASEEGAVGKLYEGVYPAGNIGDLGEAIAEGGPAAGGEIEAADVFFAVGGSRRAGEFAADVDEVANFHDGKDSAIGGAAFLPYGVEGVCGGYEGGKFIGGGVEATDAFCAGDAGEVVISAEVDHAIVAGVDCPADSIDVFHAGDAFPVFEIEIETAESVSAVVVAISVFKGAGGVDVAAYGYEGVWLAGYGAFFVPPVGVVGEWVLGDAIYREGEEGSKGKEWFHQWLLCKLMRAITGFRKNLPYRP